MTVTTKPPSEFFDDLLEQVRHGTVSRIGPGPGDVQKPSGPDVVLIEGSPSFHDPAEVDADLLEDVDAERVSLDEALRQEIPPCIHCYSDWIRGEFDV